MSGAQTSGFPNVLFNAPAAYQAAQQYQNNQLLMQENQQKITSADIAMVGQAAAPLLGMSEDDAARAYPEIIQELQARGGAKYAPSTYPGHAATQALVQRALPLMDQITTGFYTPPGSQAAIDKLTQIYTGSGAAPATGATGTGTSGDGLTGDKAHDLPLIAQRESRGDPTALNYVARGDPTAYARGATASGKYQIVNSTWRDGAALAGVDVNQYPTARDAPEGVQDKVASAIYDKYGNAPWQKGSKDWVKDEQGRYQLATVRPAVGASGGPPAAVLGTPPAAPVTPAPYRVAGAVVAPPGASTAPPVATTDLVGPRPLPPIGPNAPVVTPTSLANTPVPQPPPNRVMPGAGNGPPAAPQGAAQAPSPAQPPATAPPVATGMQSQQVQQAQDLLHRAAQLEMVAAQNPYDKRLAATAAAQAADLKQRAQLLMQTDSVVQLPDGRQLHPLTGKIDDPAKPLPHYVWDAAQGAWVDTTQTNKPEPAPTPRATEGSATWDEQQQKWVPAVPGKPGAVQGKWTLTGAGLGTFLPAANIPAQGNYDIAVEDLKKDRGEIAAIGDAGRASQQDNLRVQEMRDILQHADTGPGTETAAHLRAWIARWTPGQLSQWDGSGANLSNSAAVEMFQKLGFVGAVTQERGSTPRGGYQATKMFQQFNPGAQMLTSTNQGLLAQRLIANQAEADYAQGAQEHYNTQHQRLKGPERDYTPLSDFDAKWQAQRNPQVYAAAIGALGGQDPEIWSRGLSKEETQRVKGVVSRADPNAVIHMPGEGKVVLQPNAKPVPPGFTVQ